MDHYSLKDWITYGSARLGSAWPREGLLGASPDLNVTWTRPITQLREGQRQYELTNHLGNVLATISDMKQYVDTTSGGSTWQYSKPYLLNIQDYYPFGMLMPGRSLGSGDYRFGFNGQEKNNEIQNESNCMNFKFRIYDARLGRFLSVDPIFKDYPWNSPFAFAENDIIRSVDLEGLEKFLITQRYNSDGQLTQISILTFRTESGELENMNLLYGDKDLSKYEVVTIHTYENGEQFIPPTFSDELTSMQATTFTGEFQTYSEAISEQHSVISDDRSIQGRTTTAVTKDIHVANLNRIDYFLDDENGDKKHLESASNRATNNPEHSFVKILNSSPQEMERAKAILKSNGVNENQYTDEPIQSSKSNKARVAVGVLQQQH